MAAPKVLIREMTMLLNPIPLTNPVPEYCGFSAIVYADFFISILFEQHDR
jgi:hypothetical protein